ncbi:MAG: GTP-binding protein [Promethearchaeota archaeon]|nr:MAG: GTP-binding protein [Candidatus Lokiarchaeota archaeon]
MKEKYDYLFKAVVIGDDGVGKSTLANYFSKPVIKGQRKAIGASFHVKIIELDHKDGLLKCKLQLWVLGGEGYEILRLPYYSGSLGAILMFDLTNSSSFEHLPKWIDEIREKLNVKIPIVLVGNKSDLISNRKVSQEDLENLLNDYSIPIYFEASAKNSLNVDNIIKELLKEIISVIETFDFDAFIKNAIYYDSKYTEEPKITYKICPNCGTKAYSKQHYCKVCRHKFN